MLPAAIVTTALAGLLLPAAGWAMLEVGAPAPAVRTQAALAGEAFDFDLSRALERGPVVLYFYPKAFTKGCTIEANAFAEAMPDFEAARATVVGISRDDLDTLKEFSVRECRDRFAVGSDASSSIVKAWDAASVVPGFASRISYVIDQSGRIAFAHKGFDPLEHVRQTLKAVQQLPGAGER